MRVTQVHRFSDRLLSTVHRGTAFEYRALALLTKHLSMSLTRVGGSHDGGVDLIGWWWLPCEKNTTTCAFSSEFIRPPLKQKPPIASRRVHHLPLPLPSVRSVLALSRSPRCHYYRYRRSRAA